MIEYFQYLDARTRKKLREVSSMLKNRIEGCGDKIVHHWKLSCEDVSVGTNQLKKFSDAVKTILGKIANLTIENDAYRPLYNTQDLCKKEMLLKFVLLILGYINRQKNDVCYIYFMKLLFYAYEIFVS